MIVPCSQVPMVISAFLPASWRAPVNRFLSCKCFPAWCLLPLEVDRWEAFILCVVTVLTIQFNLVYGVGVGLVLAALRFAWAQSQEAQMSVLEQSTTHKRYQFHGKLTAANVIQAPTSIAKSEGYVCVIIFTSV